MSEEDPKSWVYVGGLPFELSEGDIVCVFSQYGEIFEISLARDKDTGKSRGFGFIKYEDPKSCELAVDNLNGAAIVGRKIRVSYPSNLNFVKARKPALVAPNENSTLPEVVPEKRKLEDSDDNERAGKSSRYYDGDEPKRLLPLRPDDEASPTRRAIQYTREDRHKRSPEYRHESRDRRSPRHNDEDRDRKSSRHHHRSERPSRHKDEERPRKSSKHSHRDRERRSPRHSDEDRDRQSSRNHSSRDEKKSHKSSRHKDDDRSHRYRDEHKESSSRHG